MNEHDSDRSDAAEAFHKRYVESCRRLGVEPVRRERADELVQTRNAMFESAGATQH